MSCVGDGVGPNVALRNVAESFPPDVISTILIDVATIANNNDIAANGFHHFDTPSVLCMLEKRDIAAVHIIFNDFPNYVWKVKRSPSAIF